jgi:cytoskeleton protein RodZ
MASSVGERLRNTRISRGLTLEQAAQATHIRKNYLEALENDQQSSLPSAVQGRGFLRLYAGYLSLAPDPLLNAWQNKTPLIEDEAISEDAQNTASASPTAAAPALQEAQTDLAPPPEVSPTSEPPQPERSPQEEGPIPVEFQEALSPAPGERGSLTIFIEIGQKLRQQREILGLSRAEVERYTRLRQHYLQALEEGRLDLLPSPVQGRGMLSNYASFLNLNEDALMLRFAEGLQLRRLERLPPTEPQPILNKRRTARQASPLRRFLTPDLVFGVVVVAAILFFAIRTALSINSVRSRESQPTARAISEILLTPNETFNTPLAETETGLAADVVTPAGLANPENIKNPTIVAGEILSSSPPVEPTLAPINNDPLQIYIIANQRAYLQIVVDGKEKFNGRIVPGNAYAFSGSNRVELITGNAAALQVFFNQNDLGTLGIAGQVARLVFVPEGMVTATPIATFTPLPGPTATVTPQPSVTPLVTQTVTPLIP